MLRRIPENLACCVEQPATPFSPALSSLFGLEKRTLLSGQVVDKAVLDPVQPLATRRESRPAAANAGKQAAFVIGLYHKYLHRAPGPTQLAHALELLSAGVSHAALTRDFMGVVSKSPKTMTAKAFVNSLYATIGGRAPTPVGQAYWLGQANSGLSRTQVARCSRPRMVPSAADRPHGAPGEHRLRHAAEQRSAQCHASVPGTFTYSPPSGRYSTRHRAARCRSTFTPTDYGRLCPRHLLREPQRVRGEPTIIWLRPQAINGRHAAQRRS